MTKTKKADIFTTPEFFVESEPDGLLASVLEDSEALYVKKLSLNDWDWARLPGKHQGGIYVPVEERDSGFFPPLAIKERKKPAAEIREAYFEIEWPTVGESKLAHLVNFRSKGEETHLTGLPKPPFREVAPASLLVIGLRGGAYRAVTVDSESPDYDLLHEMLSLPPDFRSGVFTLSVVKAEREEKVLSFIEDAVKAFFEGRIAELAAAHAAMPSTAELALAARKRFMEVHGIGKLDPFAMDKPGDALREISRGVEYEIFKELQSRGRALDLVRIILGDDPKAVSPEKALRAIILEYPRIDAILLSAAQQRKSRAGYSFEHHIEAMLEAGKVPFEKQVVIEAKKRPDFILPSLALYAAPDRIDSCEALVLSAKTTLRERWKQVGTEMKNCELYLATVDENIAANAIEDMAAQGIKLVVPESLKTSDTTEYKKHSSVLSFKTFFEADIAVERWPLWMAKGLVAAKA